MLIKSKWFKKPEIFLISLLLLLLLTGFFGKFIFNPFIITTNGDLKNNFWPLYTFVNETFSNAHSLPFWYPVKDSGISIFGHPSWGLGYPLFWLYFFLPASQASSIIIFISLFFTGIFSYLLANKIARLSFWPATFFAVTMTLSPKFFAHIFAGHITLVSSIPFIPLLFLLHWLILTNPNVKLAIALGLGVTLMYLTGGVQILFYTLVGLMGMTILTWVYLVSQNSFKQMLKTAGNRAAYLLIAIIFTFLLSFFQLIPSLLHVGISYRSELSYWEVAIPGLYLKDILNLFFSLKPDLANHETVFYLGLIPALLLPLGLLNKGRVKWTLLAITIFSFLFALGANNPLKIHRLFYEFVPGFNYFRVPTRMLFIFIPVSLLLSAMGLDWIIKKIPSRKLATALTIILVTIATTQLIIYNQSFIREQISPEVDPAILKTTDFLRSLYKSEDIPPRIYSTNRGIPEAAVFLANGQSADGIEDLFLADYVRYMKLAGNYQFSGYSTSVPASQTYDKNSIYFETPTPNAVLLGLLNVKYVFSPYELESSNFEPLGKFDQLFYYKNKILFPRAYLSFRTIRSETMADLTKFNPKNETLIPTTAKELTSQKALEEVKIDHYSPNRISLQTTSDQESYLVLSETIYPNWKVYVDGQEKAVISANYILRSVYLESGKHTVEWIYQPDNFWLYTGITLISLIIGILILSGQLNFYNRFGLK